MTKLKMGIIGSGEIAQVRHIPAYQRLQGKVELVAVQDIDFKKAQEVAKRYHIPHVFEDDEDLFKSVDAVTICTPNKYHADIAVRALNAGAHVLCEKPMAITAEECERMITAARNADKRLSIAYHYRFTEVAKVAKRAIEANEVGEPLVIRVQALRRRKVPGWGVFTNKELQGGGSLIDYGCHFLDLALWLLNGLEPVEVIGSTYNRLSKTPGQINEWGTFDSETFDVDDHVSAYIKFANGASMLFECSWAANIKEDIKHISISGSEGGINVFPFELYRPGFGTFLTSHSDVEFDEKKAGYLQAEHFVDSCSGTAELLVKPEEAMIVSKMIEAIYESSETERSVKLDEI